jgi:hypothetical protein
MTADMAEFLIIIIALAGLFIATGVLGLLLSYATNLESDIYHKETDKLIAQARIDALQLRTSNRRVNGR